VNRIAALVALAFVTGIAAPSAAQPNETLFLEVWQAPLEGEQAPDEAGPRMLLAVGSPTLSAPVAEWCGQQRLHLEPSILPRALLGDLPYDRFATDSVPLLLEILIDDVELRYALGTERPRGATGLEFPFFELCALGFGVREGVEWALDVLHVSNHRGEEVAVGLYKGTLPPSERAYLESQLGYPSELPDPAGLLLLGQGREIDSLLLIESPNRDAFDRLRSQIVR